MREMTTFAAEAMLQIINAKIWKFWISIFNIFKSVNTLLSDYNPVHPQNTMFFSKMPIPMKF